MLGVYGKSVLFFFFFGLADFLRFDMCQAKESEPVERDLPKNSLPSKWAQTAIIASPDVVKSSGVIEKPVVPMSSSALVRNPAFLGVAKEEVESVFVNSTVSSIRYFLFLILETTLEAALVTLL